MKNNTPITYCPIGIIDSKHSDPRKTPIQPVYAVGCKGTIELFSEYEEGLTDLEGFSHIYLIYAFHRAGGYTLKVKPFLEDVERGVFATRSPCRPNAIGLSIVRLVRREGKCLHLEGLDILDGTPLLDIKPYTAKFDCIQPLRNGWQDGIESEIANVQGRRDYLPGSQSEGGKSDE